MLTSKAGTVGGGPQCGQGPGEKDPRGMGAGERLHSRGGDFSDRKGRYWDSEVWPVGATGVRRPTHPACLMGLAVFRDLTSVWMR